MRERMAVLPFTEDKMCFSILKETNEFSCETVNQMCIMSRWNIDRGQRGTGSHRWVNFCTAITLLPLTINRMCQGIDMPTLYWQL